ncbi:MAG TPA: pyridoxal phosphate-dependent aminotransferase [Candidatus Mediterraneibacter merdipullorum]|nr:pyridoxal phosphate-dependent aminotransferase [Candidatus Mediterraneibacter merdipullorum]
MNFDQIIDRTGTQCCKWDSEKEYQNGKVLPMWVADMDFPAPDEVVDALRRRAEHPVYGYPNDDGSMADCLQKWLKRRHDWTVNTEEIIMSPGVLISMALFIHAVSEPGQSILIMSPVYYPFTDYIINNGRKVKRSRLICRDGEYTIDFDEFERLAAEEDTVAFLLCSPHNPVGRVFTREELKKISDICLKNGLKVFADEIHSDLVMPGFHHTPFASLSPETAKMTAGAYSASKTFNLAGLQASALIVADEELRNKILQLRDAWGLFNINNFGLEAFEAAFRSGDRYVDELTLYISKNRDYVSNFLETELPEIRCSELQGTYLMWFDCSGLNMTDEELAVFFREKAGLVLDEGTLFGPGGEQHMRMNIACPRSVLVKAVNQLMQAVRNRK